MKLMKILTAVGTSLILIGPFTPAQATSTDVVLNLEGNPTCSSLGPNSEVLGVKDPDPGDGLGGERTITLPLPNGTQTLVYTVDQLGPDGYDRIKEWMITEVTGSTNGIPFTYTLEVDDEFFEEVYPLNYIILKAQGGNWGAAVNHYGANDIPPGSPGAIEDTNVLSPGPNLAAVSFCYGLTTGINSPEPPIELADLPACENLDPIPGAGGDLFTTGITCPAPIPDPNDPDKILNEQLIINMALNDPNFGFNFIDNQAVRACTCNTSLPACNPELGPVLKGTQPDDLLASERSCLEYEEMVDPGDIPVGVNVEVPFSIEGVKNPDSYICYTIGGTRYCYGHF